MHNPADLTCGRVRLQYYQNYYNHSKEYYEKTERRLFWNVYHGPTPKPRTADPKCVR